MDLNLRCPECAKEHTFRDLLPFRSECEACAADLHVCLTCRFYDRYVENQCREDAADHVSAKDRRNLCEYWKPRALDEGEDDEAAKAKAKLAALFGGPPPSPSSSSSSGAAEGATAGERAADEAKRKLEALFKKP